MPFADHASCFLLSALPPSTRYGVHLFLAFEIGAEDDPFTIGRKMNIGFELIAVVLHIDQFFRNKMITIGPKEIDPPAVGCAGYLTGVAAIAGKEFSIISCCEMNGPFVALQAIALFFTCFHIGACNKKFYTSWRLKVKPDGAAVG